MTEITNMDVRHAAWHRDGNRCERCGGVSGLVAHPVKPLVDGGKEVIANAATLCGVCHGEYHRHAGKVRFEDFVDTIPAHVWTTFAADATYAGKTLDEVKAAWRTPEVRERFNKLFSSKHHGRRVRAGLARSRATGERRTSTGIVIPIKRDDETVEAFRARVAATPGAKTALWMDMQAKTKRRKAARKRKAAA